MMGSNVKLALAAGIVLCAGMVHAAENVACPPKPDLYKDYQAVRMHACDGKVDAVEKYFDQRQRDYEAGKIIDRELWATYAALEQPFPSAFLEAWLAKYPKSYGAHMAIALYATNLGWEARGEKWAHDTSREQFAEMRRHFTRARDHLERSIRLTSKPAFSYAFLIQLGKADGRQCWQRFLFWEPNPCLRPLLDRALAADPKAYWPRRYYMDTLEPRWGGSFRQMDTFLAELLKSDIPQWDKDRFRGMVLEQKAIVEQRPEEKLKLAEQALQVVYTPAAPREAISALGQLNRHTEIVPYATKALELNPDDVWVLQRRGVSYWLQKKYPEALDDFVKAANLGDGFSQNKVGLFYWEGLGVKQDPREAAVWFQKAAASGDKDGIDNVKRARARGLIK